MACLDEPALGQAHVRATADDDVIVHEQPQEAGALDELAREVDVLLRRRQVTGRMVVDEDDVGGRLEDRGPKTSRGRTIEAERLPSETWTSRRRSFWLSRSATRKTSFDASASEAARSYRRTFL